MKRSRSIETKRVRVSTRPAACCGATAGVVLDATTGRELDVTRPFPPGFDSQARDAAIKIAASKRWTVVP